MGQNKVINSNDRFMPFVDHKFLQISRIIAFVVKEMALIKLSRRRN